MYRSDRILEQLDHAIHRYSLKTFYKYCLNDGYIKSTVNQKQIRSNGPNLRGN